MMGTGTAKRIRLASGVLFGVAMGDAMGADVEFLSFEEMRARFGPGGPREPGPRVTDDTQMTLAVGEALLECPRPLTPVELEASLRRHFVRWNESPENNRAPGTSCVRSCLSLAEGYDWLDATAINSKGCGANMRVAPVALLNFDRDGVTPRHRAAISQFQAAMTHGHATALTAADLTATAIAELLSGCQPAELTERLREYAESQRTTYHETWLGRLWDRPGGPESPTEYIAQGWDQCIAALDEVEQALLSESLPANVCEVCGEGWIAEETLSCALLCFLIHPHDAVAALRRAANTSGDSDSIAAVAGALAGAHLGLDAFPLEWVRRSEYADRIERLGREWDDNQ